MNQTCVYTYTPSLLSLHLTPQHPPSPSRSSQFKLLHGYTLFTCKQSNAQNSPSQASTGCELPDVQAGFRKGRRTRGQIPNIYWIIERAIEFQKNTYFYLIDYAKAFDCVDHNKLWKIHKEMGIPDHLFCLLRNVYAGQEAAVKTGPGTDLFQIGKEVRQGCIL